MNFQPQDHPKENFRVKVLPATARGGLLSGFNKCLYTLSMGGASKRLNDVLNGFRWASSEFEVCAILLGDGLYKYTLQITEGVGAEDAARLATQKGSQLLDQLLLGEPRNYKLFRTSALMAEPDHAVAIAIIQRLFEEDADFARAIQQDAAGFIDRQEKAERILIGREAAYRICVQYLLDEVALYLVLAERGWLVDVYLGDELPTLARMIRGEIPSAPEALKHRISVCLKPRTF